MIHENMNVSWHQPLFSPKVLIISVDFHHNGGFKSCQHFAVEKVDYFEKFSFIL